MNGARICTIIFSALLLLQSWRSAAAQDSNRSGSRLAAPPARRENPQDMQSMQRKQELQLQANRLIQQGLFQQAAQLLDRMGSPDRDPAILMQLLDLQVRLADAEGATRTMGTLETLLPDGRPASYPELQVAGALAGANYRLGNPARAAELWQYMKEEARSSDLALSVFHSYRQVRLIDEALAWTTEQRRKTGRHDLWGLELAQLHEEAGRPVQAFNELAAWQCAQAVNGELVESRILTLVEKTGDKSSLMRHMLKRVDNRSETCPELGAAVLDALVQQAWVEEAVQLAWRLDVDKSGSLPFEVARDLARDGHPGASLALLQELEKRRPALAASTELLLLKADDLAALQRNEEALDLYRAIQGSRSSMSAQARWKSALLLHRPLGRLPEAVQELRALLAEHPSNQEAGFLLINLLGCMEREDEARAVLAGLKSQGRLKETDLTTLDFLSLRLDWWEGRLSACRDGLTAFLKTNTRQDVFNDAIDLMDLLAFATTDSLAVVEAAQADREAFAGNWRQALEQLHRAAESRKGKLAEWMDWRACQLVSREEEAKARPVEFQRFRERQPTSVRLDRLAWMELEAGESMGLPVDSLREQALALLRNWPDSMLQDTVRRRLREWENDVADPAPALEVESGLPDRPR